MDFRANTVAVLAELGYKTIRAQLLSVPPYAAAALLTIAIGYIGDRTKQRGICAMLVSPLGIICFIMLLTSNSAGVKYAATFLAAMDIYPCIPNTITWVANNTFGQYKRGVTLGVAMGWANLQGIIISNVYRGADAPRFIPGHAVVTGYLGLLFGGSVLHYVLLRRENRIRRATMSEDWALGKSAAELELLGDKRCGPSFQHVRTSIADLLLDLISSTRYEYARPYVAVLTTERPCTEWYSWLKYLMSHIIFFEFSTYQVEQ